MRRVIAAVTLILFTGCSVNRAVYDPFSATAAQSCWYYDQDSKAALLTCWEETVDPKSAPPEDHPLSLAEAIDIALVNNPKTEQSWAQAREAAAEYGKSQSSFFPTITASFYSERERTAYLASQVVGGGGKQLVVNDQSSFGPQAQLTWTLLDFGQRRYSSEAARYALYTANFAHNNTIQLTIQGVTKHFFDYLYQVKQLEANKTDLTNAQETLAAASLGLKQGVKNISDVLQARTQVLLTEITLSQQKKTANTSYATLLDQMGLSANQTLKFEKLPYLELEKIALQPLDDFIDLALQCRPDILSLRASVRSAEMSLKAAKRLFTPTLGYSLDVGRTYFGGGIHDNLDFSSTFSLSVPLFTGYQTKNTIRSAKAKLEQSQALLRENELLAISELKTAHFDVGVAHDTVKLATEYLTTAEEEYTVALGQYKAGVGTILDVISAQSSLFDARAKLASATEQWFNSLATLTYSAGIFFQPSGDYLCD